MEKNIHLFFTGIAGSGKTSLVEAFKSWMDTEGLDCIAVNLDPGATRIPYDADVDIRDWITLEILQKKTSHPNRSGFRFRSKASWSVRHYLKGLSSTKTKILLMLIL